MIFINQCQKPDRKGGNALHQGPLPHGRASDHSGQKKAGRSPPLILDINAQTNYGRLRRAGVVLSGTTFSVFFRLPCRRSAESN